MDYLVKYNDILHKKDENMGGIYIIWYNVICELLKKEHFEDIITSVSTFQMVLQY